MTAKVLRLEPVEAQTAQRELLFQTEKIGFWLKDHIVAAKVLRSEPVGAQTAELDLLYQTVLKPGFRGG